MIPLVAVGVFLRGWTVYFYDGMITCVFHTDTTGQLPTPSPVRWPS